MNICFTCDDNFAIFLATTMASILINSDKTDQFNFYIIDAGLSAKTKHRIKKLKRIKNFNVMYEKMNDNEFEEYPINPNLSSKIYYYRLKITQRFPELDRVLFLDTDIIVKSSLSELYYADLENKCMAAGCNANLEGFFQNSRLNLADEHIYFNAGIMLIDCRKWKEEKVFERTVELANTRKDLIWADQDMLNIIFDKNNYKILEPRWNFWSGMRVKSYEPTIINYKKWYKHAFNPDIIKKSFKKPCILHMAGGAKADKQLSVLKTILLFCFYATKTPYKKEGIEFIKKRIRNNYE